MIGLSGLADGSGNPRFVARADAQYNPNPRPLPPNTPPRLKLGCDMINNSGCRKIVITPIPGGNRAKCELFDNDGNCMASATIPMDPNVSPRLIQPYLKPEIKMNSVPTL